MASKSLGLKDESPQQYAACYCVNGRGERPSLMHEGAEDEQQHDWHRTK